GWGFRAIRYDEITKENSPANRLFKEKINWHLENFDGIRFDVGWQYFAPKLYRILADDEKEPFPVHIREGEIVNYIEQLAKEIKGKNYDTKKLMYECDAGPEDFSMFKWVNKKPFVKSYMQNRTPVITTVYESTGWGNPRFYQYARLNDYMIGTNNHDSTPLRMLAEGDYDDKGNEVVELKGIREGNIEALSQSLRLDKDWLSNPDNYTAAKFAELFQAKNHFLFFNDVIGNNYRLDHEGTSADDYRLKITNDYEKQYHLALQNNKGFNLAESLAIAMRAQHLDITKPELYRKIENYSKILKQKGALTRKEADAIQS
ncbi:hypothetical protein IJ531_02170, partial [bacterium]|nr:hypothetical protein [bacterium]